MSAIRLAAIRLAGAWVRMVLTSRAWVLAAYCVFLPLFWLGCRRTGPPLWDALAAYDAGRLALLVFALMPCLWLAVFSQRVYQMPSRSGAWMTHDFHFLLTQPLPLGRILFAVAAVWTLGDLPVAISTAALLAGFLEAIGAPAGLAVLAGLLAAWMVFSAFLLLGLARLAFHRYNRPAHRLGMAAVGLVLGTALWLSLAPPSAAEPRLALAWVLHPVPGTEPTLLERSVTSLEPLLRTYRRTVPLLAIFPPYQLFRGVALVASGDGRGFGVLLAIALALGFVTLGVLAAAEPLSRADTLALSHSIPEEPLEPAAPLSPWRERRLRGLDAKEAQLWAQFWGGPSFLAAAVCAMTWYMLKGGYGVLATAKLLGMATWMVGSLAGDSLGWERRGLTLCQLLPLTPAQVLAAKARWAALTGVLALVLPYALTAIALDAEPFAELIRGVLVLTFLVFVAAHAGVAVGALLRDLSDSGQPGMGPLLGALLWLGLCAAIVAQIFLPGGYPVFAGLFFDLILVLALWQRACVRLKNQHEPEEVVNEETTFADAVLVFLMAYLLVVFVVIRAQTAGASSAAINALRTYLLTALFPIVLAALTWIHLRLIPHPGPETPRKWWLDLFVAVPVAALTVSLSFGYSWAAARLGWVKTQELGSGVQLLRGLLAGLPGAGLLVFLLVAVLAPVAEEGFFRGLFFRGVRRLQPHDYRIAVLLSSLAFALLHPVAHFPVVFTMGTLLGVLVEWRGSLVPCILAHALHNAAMVAIFLAAVGK